MIFMADDIDQERPRTRADCVDGVRPCPWVGCRHNLYADVNPETGTFKPAFPELEPSDMKESCALDVAERGGITLEEVGEALNCTRENVRLIEQKGLRKLRFADIDGRHDLVHLAVIGSGA